MITDVPVSVIPVFMSAMFLLRFPGFMERK
jgi:hypothetical protein